MLYGISKITYKDGASHILADTLDLVFLTYLGGLHYDYLGDIALESDDDIYIVGSTDSTDLPTTEGTYQRTHSGGNYWEMDDVFIMKLSGDEPEILYCSYLGGSGVNDAASGILSVHDFFIHPVTSLLNWKLAMSDITISIIYP